MNGKDMKAEALAICKDFLDGPWREVSLEELEFSEMRGGLSNSLYLCALPEHLSGCPREVVLRIYGGVAQQEGRPDLMAAEAVTFVLLSERGLGPKLYGLFPKGRLEQYIPSHYLSAEEMRIYTRAIAREMAKIHTLEIPARKTPDLLLNFITKWLAEATKVLQHATESFAMSFDEYAKEVEWIKNEVVRVNCPVVYCHNDLQGGNILYREDVPQSDRPSLVLIDFEFGAYNYRSYDFASHFCERCFDNDVPEFPHFRVDPSRFPSEREQIEFLEAYEEQFFAQEGAPVAWSHETVLREIQLFACMAQITACLWSVSMATTTEKGRFGYREYEKVRAPLYRKYKEQYLALSSLDPQSDR